MNRLILIGNGFDLAHGLKTSYRDFILDLFKNEIIKTTEMVGTEKKGIISRDIEKLFKIEVPVRYSGDFLDRELKKINDFQSLRNFVDNNKIRIVFFNSAMIIDQTYDDLSYYNWVDIEELYYDSLVNIVSSNSGRRLGREQEEKASLLNKELVFLREKLIQYLNEITSNSQTFGHETSAHFWNSLKGKFVNWRTTQARANDSSYPQRIHILNFNYTDTIFKYQNPSVSFENRDAHIDYNFIHGSLREINNIIFGYGDREDEYYPTLKNLDNGELLKHVKNFHYLEGDNYPNLEEFINSDIYEIYLIGHSCGVSDRVMLKNIFEHQNCKSIQIFYHKRDDDTDDYSEKTRKISKHFGDENEMHRKIVPKNYCSPMSNIKIGRFSIQE